MYEATYCYILVFIEIVDIPVVGNHDVGQLREAVGAVRARRLRLTPGQQANVVATSLPAE